MVGFLDPVFLFGLLAIAVPVVLHLLLRRRVPVFEFPLTRLLTRAERSRQPRKRLNRVLLLLARAAMLAALALALARMTLGPAGAVVAEGPVAAVVVLDDSLSMQAEGAGARTAFEAGVDEARSVLRALPEGSFGAVLVASDPAPGEATGLLADPRAAAAALEGVGCGYGRSRLGPALAAAVRLLDQSPVGDRRVVLVSDMARHAFEGVDLRRGERPPAALEIVAPVAATGVNRSVSGLDVDVLPDGRLGLSSRVTAWGAAAEGVQLEVRVAAAAGPERLVGRSEVSPGGGASIERRFEVQPPGEGHGRVRAEIGADFLPADDVREVGYHVALPLRVLVIDGDPQNLSFGSETFYLERALAPGVGLDVEPTFLTLAELRPAGFADHDVVILCNVPELSVERAAALEAAVADGTGLIVALGNRVAQPVYNGRLAALLPATIGLLRRPGTGVGAGPLDSGLELHRVTVRSWFSLEPDPASRVAARLASGEPLVVEGAHGAGSVLLLATTLDRDWTDLPISPRFLPFLHDVIERVAARDEVAVPPTVTVGTPADLSSHAGLGATVVLPGGRRTALPEDGWLRATSLPGVARIEVGGRVVGSLSIVLDPAESDLTRLSSTELADVVGPALHLGAADAEAPRAGGRWPAWKWLLGALVGLTAAEAWLCRRAW